MHVSLGELAATCQKACIGAGSDLGAAEDISGAVVWWALRGRLFLPQLHRMLDLLDRGRVVYGEADSDVTPMRWRGTADKPLSSVLMGAAPVELVVAAGQGTLVMDSMDSALFLIPRLESGMSLFITLGDTGGEVSIHARDDGISIQGDIELMTQDQYCRLVIHHRSAPAAPDRVIPAEMDEPSALASRGVDVDENQWRGLYEYARRTLVPATAQSRAKGAGAGLSDND